MASARLPELVITTTGMAARLQLLHDLARARIEALAIMDDAELVDQHAVEADGQSRADGQRASSKPRQARRAAPTQACSLDDGLAGTPSGFRRISVQLSLAAPPPTVRIVANRSAPSSASRRSPGPRSRRCLRESPAKRLRSSAGRGSRRGMRFGSSMGKRSPGLAKG